MPRILIIDDDPGIREVLETILRQAGHEPLCAADGREGVALHLTAPAALALVDLVMPVKDGVATIHELSQVSPQLPIIAMTGQPNMGRVFRVAQRLGARRILRKPFHAAELLSVVASVLGPSMAVEPPAGSTQRPLAG